MRLHPPRARLCALAGQAAARLRGRARYSRHGRRTEGVGLSRQGRQGDPVAASGRSGKRRHLRRLPQGHRALSPACSSTARRRSSPISIRNICPSKLAASAAAATGLPLLEGAASSCPYRRVPGGERAARSTPRRCSASCSTASASATTAPSGAASSCSPTMQRLRAARLPQAGRDARRRAGRARALAQPLRASDGRDGLGGVRDELRRAGAVAAFSKPSRARRSTPCLKRNLNSPLASSCGRLFDASRRRSASAANANPMKVRAAPSWKRWSTRRRCASPARTGYPFAIPRAARQRPALHRAGRHVARGARRPAAEDARSGHGRALPQLARRVDRRDGCQAGAAR